MGQARKKLPVIKSDSSRELYNAQRAAGYFRPRVREDCAQVPRPCPYVRCQYNAYLRVDEKNGAIVFNFPGNEPWEVPPDQSCLLDAQDRGEDRTLKDIGAHLGVTRERVRQVQNKGLARLQRRPDVKKLREFLEADVFVGGSGRNRDEF